MGTRENIINTSLKLFSVGGYEAVSMRDIADSVGIRQSSIYKHFKSKKDILDTIVSECEEKLNTIFMDLKVPGGINATDISEYENITPEDLIELCCNIFSVQTKDEEIEMFKRLLIIEQYKNEKLAEIYHEIFYERPMRSQKKIFDYLIRAGIFYEQDSEVLALEFFSPFFAMRHRYGDEYDKQKDILSKHIRKFIKDNVVNDREDSKSK